MKPSVMLQEESLVLLGLCLGRKLTGLNQSFECSLHVAISKPCQVSLPTMHTGMREVGHHNNYLFF